MLLKHQLPAAAALAVILIVSLATGVLLIHAIDSVDFVSAANADVN